MEVEPRERAGPVVVEAKGYKLKTRKAAAKRFKVTGSGKVLRRKPGKQHINKHKSTTRLKRLEGAGRFGAGVGVIVHCPRAVPSISISISPERAGVALDPSQTVGRHINTLARLGQVGRELRRQQSGFIQSWRSWSEPDWYPGAGPRRKERRRRTSGRE